MRTHKLHPVTLAMIAMLSTTYVYAEETTDLGKITVTGEGDKLGTGLMIDEDTPKAKSTVTKAQLDKTRSSANAFQDLNLLPGVNATSQDATGMAGGNLRVRGFNSDQMGFTIDGAPVNDSGSFAVYPQEFTDKENMCELFVTQGSTDTEAPHVGASGGNIGMTTCGAESKGRWRFAQSLGALDYRRTFLRYDTGKIGNFKGYLSYSNSKVDKWRGEGVSQREHVDGRAEYDLGGGSKLQAGLMANYLMNHQYRALYLDEVKSLGYNADYSTVRPTHKTPVSGTAQTDTLSGDYYDYERNPFQNVLLTFKANLQLSEKTRLDIEPYYWYGYGGTTYPTTVTESSNSSYVGGGVADVNGDGDVKDKVAVLTGSMTRTDRPGVNVKMTHYMDNHKIMGGFWLEQAYHKQTRPITTFSNDGHTDFWLDDNLLKYQNGSTYQGRNWKTISTGKSVFVQDTMDLLDSKMQVTPAISYREIKRDFTNIANNGTASASATSSKGYGYADYRITRTYQEVLPGVSGTYQFNEAVQGFAGVSTNFRAPGNYDYGNLVKTYSGTVATSLYPVTVKPETSTNIDIGTRFRGDWYKASLTAFYVAFKDRIAASYDPDTGVTHDWNVGSSTIKGLELEGGTAPYKGFSVYGSLSYTKSTLDENMPSSTGYYDTKGKIFPDTPEWMASASVQWASGPYMINLAAKYTGRRYLTLENDVDIGGYTLVDLNAAWKLPLSSSWGFKNPVLRLNVSNLLDRKYLIANSGSGSNVTINDTVGSPKVYTGAPRFASMTFQVDF